LVTRSEIEKALWSADQFVEFEHAINTAMRKIREALEMTWKSLGLFERCRARVSLYRCVGAPVEAAQERLPIKNVRLASSARAVSESETFVDPSSTAATSATDFRLPRRWARHCSGDADGVFWRCMCSSI